MKYVIYKDQDGETSFTTDTITRDLIQRGLRQVNLTGKDSAIATAFYNEILKLKKQNIRLWIQVISIDNRLVTFGMTSETWTKTEPINCYINYAYTICNPADEFNIFRGILKTLKRFRELNEDEVHAEDIFYDEDLLVAHFEIMRNHFIREFYNIYPEFKPRS
jgi:hypothetical protein